jgi:hypothetical protein
MGVQAKGCKSHAIDGGNGAAGHGENEMQNTSLNLAVAALAIVVATAGVAEAGKFSGIGIKGGSSGHSNPVDVIVHNTDRSPDFGGVFNPQPETKPRIDKVIDVTPEKPVIHGHIDITPDKPVIHKVLDLFPDSPATGNGGGFITYREAAHINPGLKLSCIVAGTPTEFPDDLFVANTGLVVVPAGTKVRWQIASLGLEGVATLQSALKPGKSIGIRGVLKGGAEIGTPCAITAIGL